MTSSIGSRESGAYGAAQGAVYAAVTAAAAAWARLRGALSDPAAAVWRERVDVDSGESVRGGVWIHGASVGEIGVSRPLVEELRRRLPDVPIMLTCNTQTGREAARGLAVDAVRYFPIDSRGVIRRFLSATQPRLFVFVEKEIWPNLLRELENRAIPSVMVNARVSERSYGHYRRVRGVIGPALGRVARLCARDSVSADRLTALGARPERVEVSGDMKMDTFGRGALEPLDERIGRLLRSGGEAGAVFVAASTREGEEAPVLEAFAQTATAVPGARLVLAPRHPERFEGVWNRIEASGIGGIRWSRCNGGATGSPGADAAWSVLLVDTIGDLKAFYRGATACFVGGSLASFGGHNVLEPAAFGVPVVVGPHVFNVAEQVDALERAGALRLVRDADGLATAWSAWARDPASARLAGQAGAAMVRSGKGAAARVADRVAELLATSVAGPAPRRDG